MNMFIPEIFIMALFLINLSAKVFRSLIIFSLLLNFLGLNIDLELIASMLHILLQILQIPDIKLQVFDILILLDVGIQLPRVVGLGIFDGFDVLCDLGVQKGGSKVVVDFLLL